MGILDVGNLDSAKKNTKRNYKIIAFVNKK